MIKISLTGTANIGLFGNSEYVIAVKVYVGPLAEIDFNKVIETLMMFLQLIINNKSQYG